MLKSIFWDPSFFHHLCLVSTHFSFPLYQNQVLFLDHVPDCLVLDYSFHNLPWWLQSPGLESHVGKKGFCTWTGGVKRYSLFFAQQLVFKLCCLLFLTVESHQYEYFFYKSLSNIYFLICNAMSYYLDLALIWNNFSPFLQVYFTNVHLAV